MLSCQNNNAIPGLGMRQIMRLANLPESPRLVTHCGNAFNMPCTSISQLREQIGVDKHD